MVIGAWGIHVVLIIALKIFYDTMPGVSQETSWTLTNISYMMVRAHNQFREEKGGGVWGDSIKKRNADGEAL